MEIVFYTKTDGTKPAKEFLDSLDKKMRVKMSSVISVLEKYGIKVREPYSKNIGDGIFELRAKVGHDISRVLYFFFIGNKAVLTNGFIKKTVKTPPNVIMLAQKYRSDYIEKERLKNGRIHVS